MYHVPTLFLAYKYLQYHWTCSVLLVGRSATIEKYAVCKAFHMSVCSIIKMFLFSLFAGMFGICHTNKIQFTVSQTLHATLFLYQTSSCSMCNFYGNCLEKNIIFIFNFFLLIYWPAFQSFVNLKEPASSFVSSIFLLLIPARMSHSVHM